MIRWENGRHVPGPVAAILKMLEAKPQETLAILRDGQPQAAPAGPTAASADEIAPSFDGAGPPPPRVTLAPDDDVQKFGFFDPPRES